ncbi:hypothetical protein ACR6C2_17945 [Streptomyces sp. INA 01156]
MHHVRPTFWSRKRLASVDVCTQREQGVRLTEYRVDADGNETGRRNACGLDGDAATTTLLSKVDSWSLKQSFPWNLTGEYTALWLEAITRTGYAVDGSTARLNPVSFGHNENALPNRVKNGSSDTNPLFARLRIQDVVSEYGGRTHVDYKAPEGKCLTGAARPTPDRNRSLCYPVHWHADGELEDKRISWFHKHVVDRITEFPRLADAQDIVTTYDYATDGDAVDGALWAKSQSEFSAPAAHLGRLPRLPGRHHDHRHHGHGGRQRRLQVRHPLLPGHERRRPRRRHPGEVVRRRQTLRRDDRHHRRDPGHRPQGVRRHGRRVAHLPRRVGRHRHRLGRPHGQHPRPPVRLATRDRTDGPDVTSERVTLGRTSTISKASVKGPDGSYLRTVTSETEYDATGLPTKVKDHGDTAVSGDESCTATSYVHNTSGTNHLVGLVARTVTTTGTSTCSTDLSSATGSKLVSASRMYYDGATSSTATPTKGLVTKTETPNGAGTGWETAHPESRTEYDSTGRVTKVTDPTGVYNTTTYTPGGQVYKIETVTGNKVVDGAEVPGFKDTTLVEPGRGVTVKSTDANNRVESYEYDPLGRAVAAWDATQSATDDPTVTYTYNIDLKQPVSVVVRSLADNPSTAAGDGTYESSTTIYDGLGRERQTQTPAVGGGRLITDTLHNSAGQVRYTRNAYYMEKDPGTELVVPASESLVPNATSYTYDGLGRVLTVTPVHRSYPQTGQSFDNGGKKVTTTDRRTRYEYELDHTVIRQPKGTPASRVWTDALGRTTRQDTFSDTALSEAGAISTTYEYDLRGDMVTSTDDVGNTRTWTYDALGRVTDTTDPDTGATRTDYDAYGRVAKATDARGQAVSYTYDRLNRVEQVKVTPKGSTSSTLAQTYAYDGATGGKGQLSSATRYTDGKAYTTTIGGYTADYQPTDMTTALPPGSTAGLTADGFATQYKYTYTYNSDGQLETYTTPAASGLTPRT